MTHKEDYKKLLLSFIWTLTLADHMGDVLDDIDSVLGRLGINIQWDDADDLRTKLTEMGIGSLYGDD